MCKMSIELSARFDQNCKLHTFEKIVKNILQQKTLKKLDLEPKGEGHNRIKNSSSKNIRVGYPLVIGVTLMPTAVKEYVDPHTTRGST